MGKFGDYGKAGQGEPVFSQAEQCRQCRAEGRDKDWLGRSKCSSCGETEGNVSSYDDWMG